MTSYLTIQWMDFDGAAFLNRLRWRANLWQLRFLSPPPAQLVQGCMRAKMMVSFNLPGHRIVKSRPRPNQRFRHLSVLIHSSGPKPYLALLAPALFLIWLLFAVAATTLFSDRVRATLFTLFQHNSHCMPVPCMVGDPVPGEKNPCLVSLSMLSIFSILLHPNSPFVVFASHLFLLFCTPFSQTSKYLQAIGGPTSQCASGSAFWYWRYCCRLMFFWAGHAVCPAMT